MTFEIKDYFETPVILEPRVELYTVYDFMGKELPGLAIVLDMPIQGADEKEQFAILTKSFGEFLGLKNSAYVDINNCPFAPQLLNRGFAKDTGLYKESGFCSYPLWTFDETVLKETGGAGSITSTAAPTGGSTCPRPSLCPATISSMRWAG